MRPDLRWPVMALPAAAVLVGLYRLGSAWATVLIYQAGMLALLLGARFRWRRLLRGWPGGRAIAAVGLGAAGGALPWLLHRAGWIDLSGLDARLGAVGLDRGAWWPFAALYVVATPLLEEAFWRDWLAGDRTRPILPDDVAFAGYHVLVLLLFVPAGWALVALPVLTVAAAVWRRLTLRLGGPAVPVASHLGADLGTVLAVAALTGWW